MADNNNQGLQIELNPEVAKGSYSNLAVITHSHNEFILDFATMLPGLPKAQVGNRIIMVPEHAKRLLFALQENVSKYESQFGQIQMTGAPQQKGTFNIEDFNPGGAKS